MLMSSSGHGTVESNVMLMSPPVHGTVESNVMLIFTLSVSRNGYVSSNGLQRAPVLVAIALIEAGFEPLDAVSFIRKQRLVARLVSRLVSRLVCDWFPFHAPKAPKVCRQLIYRIYRIYRIYQGGERVMAKHVPKRPAAVCLLCEHSTRPSDRMDNGVNMMVHACMALVAHSMNHSITSWHRPSC